MRTLVASLVIWILVNVGAGVGLPASASAFADSECFSGGTHALPWRACVYRSADASEDIAYYFHGLGGSERDASAPAATLRAIWAAQGKRSPTIVALSFGPAWLLAPQGTRSPGAAITRAIAGTILPRLEATLGGLRGRRILVGASMGGFNAVQLLLRRPSLFDRVALLCPALSLVSPFASAAEIADYVARTGANPDKVRTALELGRRFYARAADWDAASPFRGSRNRLGTRTPKLLVSVGEQDDWGFQEGSKAFAELAAAQGVRDVRWRPVAGAHCSFDTMALADFIVGD